MVSEKFSVDFLFEFVEVVYWDDIYVVILVLLKFEDLVKVNQNLFVFLEVLFFLKDNVVEVEVVMKNFGLKVDIFSFFLQYKLYSFVNMSVDDYCLFRGFCY